MSGRTYCNHEIVQWGYVALVCIALAFSSITRAAAIAKPSDYRLERQTTSKRNACLAIKEVADLPDGKMCEARGDINKSEPKTSEFGSALVVNASLGLGGGGGSSLLSPLPEQHTD